MTPFDTILLLVVTPIAVFALMFSAEIIPMPIDEEERK